MSTNPQLLEDALRRVAPSHGPTVDVYGDCLASRSAIREGLEKEDWTRLVTLPGNYCLAARSGNTVMLVACAVGPPNLFYMHVEGRLLYAPSVVELVRLARVPWRWNWRALADVAALEHCVDGDSLHADVRRLRAGEVVLFDGRELRRAQVSWIERMAAENPSPDSALEALRAACRLYLDGEAVVSMSAGFDSRLLLACLLSSGVKPRLVTMGHRDSTDARVSEAIARRFDLPLKQISLDQEDYLKHAGTIARVTSGSKTFQNWHTYLYARSASLSAGSRLFIGSNGEAARSYYLDKGIAAVTAERLASGYMRQAFWRAKSRPIFLEHEIRLLNPAFAQELTGPRAAARLGRLQELSAGRLLGGLDQFYGEQRVTNFIANGLSLVAQHARPAAPMLDARWSAQVWNLPRHWKMDSAWHRFAIGKTCGGLLEIEEEKSGAPMSPVPRRLYWIPRRRPRVSKPYMDYSQLFRSERILQLVDERRGSVEPVAQPALLSLVFARHTSGANRVRAGSFLLTILFFLECLADEGIAADCG